MDLFQRDLLCTQEWSKIELEAVLSLAAAMKYDRCRAQYQNILQGRTFVMLFYNPSLRTRLSFESAAAELGGQALFLEPRTLRLQSIDTAGETIEDIAQVISRYAVGVGIRILEDKISHYGEGDELLREYAKWASVPVVSMAHDKFHPCQGLADIMGWAEWLGRDIGHELDLDSLRGRKLLITWGSGQLARSWSSVQESLLIGSRFGMDVVLAHPAGYDLDAQVIEQAKRNCVENGRAFTETIDPTEGYCGAHIVYSRNWISPQAYQNGLFQRQEEIGKASQFREWICDAAKMKLTDNAVFTHPMPIDRGNEVTSSIASGPRSCIYGVAENRLHIQKAIMALTMRNSRQSKLKPGD